MTIEEFEKEKARRRKAVEATKAWRIANPVKVEAARVRRIERAKDFKAMMLFQAIDAKAAVEKANRLKELDDSTLNQML